MALNIDSLKQKLETEKAELEKELSSLGIMDPESGDWGAIGEVSNPVDITDKNDQADRDEEFRERANILGELEKRYNDIQNALKKIEANDGSYGICEESGQPIEEDRLVANPAARTCKSHM